MPDTKIEKGISLTENQRLVVEYLQKRNRGVDGVMKHQIDVDVFYVSCPAESECVPFLNQLIKKGLVYRKVICKGHIDYYLTAKGTALSTTGRPE